MFVVTFKLQAKPSNRLEITQSLQGYAEEVKKIEECIDTRIYQDINNENIFFLLGEWQKQRNMDDHLNSSLFAALLGVKGLLVKSPEIKFMTEN